MKRGKALCRILAVLLICALVAGFAPVAETISAPAQETAAGAEPAETVTDVLPSGEDGDPDAAKDPGETKDPGEAKDPGETPNPGETPTVPTIVSAEDTTPAEWAQSRTVTIQTAGPVDKVQYRVKDTEEWKSAAAGKKNGEYQFVLTEISAEVVTCEVRALYKKQKSETVEVEVGNFDTTAPTVEVQTIENDNLFVSDTTTWKVTIRDEQSGLNKDEIRIRAFYSTNKETKTYIDSKELNRALKNAKQNYESGDFVVEFTLPNSEKVGMWPYSKHYPIGIEVAAKDKVGNELNGGDKPDQLGDPISSEVTPSILDNGVYRVGDQSELKITGAGKNSDITVFVDNDKNPAYKGKADGNGTATLACKDIMAEKENGSHQIKVAVGKRTATLDVYYVSGAPEFNGVTFENQSAFKSFVHTITGGLMFAGKNDLVVEHHERKFPFNKDDVSWDYEGTAYYWQSDNDKDKVDTPVNPALTMENGKVVLKSNEQPWKAVTEDIGLTDAQRCISWPTTKDFSGYLHVVVWNEVGTCTQYVYKAETGKELKLTNLGVFNGENNGVAVFVTTPAKDADGNPDGEKAYTEKTEDGNPNWVKQVNFDVQWDADSAWKQLNLSEDTYQRQKDADGNPIPATIEVTAITEDNDVQVKEDKNASGETTKKFSLGAKPGDDVSYSGEVKFSVKVAFAVVEKAEDGTDENNNPQYKYNNVTKEYTFPVTVEKVYVQNYLKEPTVTAVSETKTEDGKKVDATRTNKPEKDKEGKDDIEQCWFNGNDNVLKSLVITESGKSNAPYTLYYSLQAPGEDNNMGNKFEAKNGALTVFDQNNWQSKIDKNDQPVYVNEDGVYTLTVEATDAAGNKSETAVYTIKYDVSAPDVFAVFSLSSKDYSPFYKQQRTIDIKVSDKLFKGSENVIFKEGEPVSGNGVYTLTRTMTNEQQNVSIETTIQYKNGNPPRFDGAWTYTGAGEGKQTLPSWSGTYKYGSVDGNIRDGDDYTLCITATDEAGNVTVTNADGTFKKNGETQYADEDKTIPTNRYTVQDKGSADFTIDQTTPEVSVRFDNNSVVNGKYFPAGRTATITVVEHNFDKNKVALDVTGASGSTDWVDDGDTHTATVSFLNDADCKFAIEVTDKAGNICKNDAVNYGGSAAPGEFVIDTTAPTLTLTGVNGPFADACTPGFEGQDANMSTEYELHLMRSVRENAADDATALCSRELVNISTTDIRAVFQNIPDMLDNAEYYSDGIYKLSVTIRDMADNATTQEATFAVNRHGSFYIYGEALANLVTKQFAQNDFVDAQTGAWTIMEYNASPVQPDSVQLQIYRDNALVTSVTPEIKGGMDDATGLYRYVYELDRNMFAQDGLYKVQVRSTDEAGNLSENIDEVDDNGNVTTPEKYQCTLSFVIDNVDPEFKQITGLEKKRYREDSHEINFAVADTYGLARVSVLSGETVVAEYLCAAEIDALGGETKLAANQKPMPNELTLESVSGDVMLQGGKSAQTITFVAVDKAGNTYTTGSADQKPLGFHQKVTISTNGFVLYIHNTWAVVLTVVALAAIAFGVWYGVSKKKKREGAAS